MEHIPEKLKRGRRSLDELSDVSIIDDFRYDSTIDKWYIHLKIDIKRESTLLPRVSNWYAVVSSVYPEGKIDVYPDVNNSLTVTFPHQSNNTIVSKNGLWREGNLCLEYSSITEDINEPYNIDERLLYHIKRAIHWLNCAIDNKLVKQGDTFEHPHVRTDKHYDKQFVFSEDIVTYMQWEDLDVQYGLAELDVYKNNPWIYYVKKFKDLNNNIVRDISWGTFLSKTYIKDPIIAPWIMLKDVPVWTNWQYPSVWGELKHICDLQKIDLFSILKQLFAKIRDKNHHLMLIGYPIPRKIGEERESIQWQALYLPILSAGKNTQKGFRNNLEGWWMRDKLSILRDNSSIEWIPSENWNTRQISERGKMDNSFHTLKILILGAGCVGASISEMFVRNSVENITIMDSDLFSVGNLCRHSLDLDNIGELKEVSLGERLNKLNPHANVKIIMDKLKFKEDGALNVQLEEYNLIIDCTGSNSVLRTISQMQFAKKLIFVTVSVGLGAKRMYLNFQNSQTFDYNEFAETIKPYTIMDKNAYADDELPRDGIGCWHPTFPGRSDDILIASSSAVKAIEKYVKSNSTDNLTLVFEQQEDEHMFSGYKVVNEYGRV